MSWEEVTIGECRLIRGDCREVLPTLEAMDAVVTDPPYGIKWCFTGQGSGQSAAGSTVSRTKGQRICGDSDAFDPTFLLAYPKVVIWGMHHFSDKLHRGSVLVWPKKYFDAYGTFLSDADLAWMKGGCGVYLAPIINPASYQADKAHPTQKPVTLMLWCLEKARVPSGAIVLDPYMGSGSTGVACVMRSCAFVGVEIDERYFHIACRRIEDAYRQLPLLPPMVSVPTPCQEVLL